VQWCGSNLPAFRKNDAAHEAAFRRCNDEADDSLALAITHARFEKAFVALVPVPLAWGFVYLVLFLVRWVKRGFVKPSE
jgi:hypothetical protein